jgi:hypothetical protein
MSAPTMRYLVSRALTLEEMNLIVGQVRRAVSTRQLLGGALMALYDTVLGASRPIVADRYAIPGCQWEVIMREVTGRAAEWGTSVEVGLELINRKPDTYDDPLAPIPPGDTVDHRPARLSLQVTREAVDTITNIDRYLGGLAAVYGRDSDVYRTAADSWIRQVTVLFSLGMGAHTIVRRDGGPGSLSLVAETASGLVFGIVFHQRADLADHDHDSSHPLGSPAPGEWLAHS